MPYIPLKRRMELLRLGNPENVGELTYLLYKTALDYLSAEPDYAERAEVVAALENAKLEFYRRKLAPYEDEKIEQNGDIG